MPNTYIAIAFILLIGVLAIGAAYYTGVVLDVFVNESVILTDKVIDKLNSTTSCSHVWNCDCKLCNLSDSCC